jgi:peptide/nickel transport system substrate-binding protein
LRPIGGRTKTIQLAGSSICEGVSFHDGSTFDADAAIWNLDRYYDADSPQFEPQGGAQAQARVPLVASYEKIDDMTIAITTTRPASYFPYMFTYVLFSSPAHFEAVGGSWSAFAEDPWGTGPFRVSEFRARESITLTRNEDYWDSDRIPRLDRLVLYPMPESTTRLAALRSGQVDWIEVPPPDGVPSLEAAGYEITMSSYPHVWPWLLNLQDQDSPFQGVLVRRAINYCIDRDGLVTILNGLAEPSYGIFKPGEDLFGEPENRYMFDPDQARELLSEAGYAEGERIPVKVMITASGSGQMTPLPMNEFLQDTVAQCGFDVEFEQVEWGTMLVALRNEPTSSAAFGVNDMNMSLPPSTDVSQMALYFYGGNLAPRGRNWSHWVNEEFDELIDRLEASRDPDDVTELGAQAHAILVDDAPWVFIVHDRNARAMTSRQGIRQCAELVPGLHTSLHGRLTAAMVSGATPPIPPERDPACWLSSFDVFFTRSPSCWG